MASPSPKPEQEAESEADKSTTEKPDSSNSNNENEKWDGKERRSEDRPWGDVKKPDGNEEQILSQEERDALSGDIEELSDASGVTSYDFYSPAHINKSNLPALSIVNERIVDLMNEKIHELFQREIEVNADDITIIKYGEFINSLPSLVDVNQISITKIEAQALLCVDGALVEILMDAYFGGEGKLTEAVDKEILTPAELNLSNKLLEIFLESSKHAWEKLEQLDFTILQRESQPKLINLIDESELVIVCKFKISLGGASSYIRVAYPYKSLDPIKHVLRSVVSDQNEESDAQWKNQIFNSLKAVPIELKTVLAEFDLSVDQVTKLKKGDVIPFVMPESVTVYSSSTPIFKGKVGTVNDAVAIRIDTWINRPDGEKHI